MNVLITRFSWSCGLANVKSAKSIIETASERESEASTVTQWANKVQFLTVDLSSQCGFIQPCF